MKFDKSMKFLKMCILFGKWVFIPTIGAIGLILGGPLLATLCILTGIIGSNLLINNILSAQNTTEL